MKLYTNIYIIVVYIVIQLLDTIVSNQVNSSTTNPQDNIKKVESPFEKLEDAYYLIFINNTIENKFDNGSNSIISDIHTLIVNNKHTYKEPEKLKKIEQDSKLNKTQFRYLIDYGDSNYVYPISNSLSGEEDTALLYSYLSEDLVKIVRSLPNVITCELNNQFEYFNSSLPSSPLLSPLLASSITTTLSSSSAAAAHYNKKDIKLETNWKDVEIRENSDLHLSILSQGKFKNDDDENHPYDTNYYYPSTAGKDIDIFIFDSGFNFNHAEFSNKDERDAKCILMISGGRVIQPFSDDYCHGPNLDDHGSGVADNAAGLKHGVANKANVYGIYLNELDEVNYIAGLEYISKYLFRPYKAVFNFSFGGYYSISDLNKFVYREQSIINYLASQGGIFVAAAGNENVSVYSEKDNRIVFPCSFNHVICVGGIENVDSKDPFTTIMHSSNYKKAKLSNYGTFVSLYAPFYTHVAFKDSNLQDVEYLASGTSFSSSLVAGIVATIMSENKDIKFTTYSMLYYLTTLSSNNTISGVPDDYPNLLINNGKNTVYPG
ncbi:subtilisin-like protein [Piromyces finnis]|uniref:Subtilisin-like protein n=1 Tax=Piromyces finnis TaxID=1754191 RepID=A0A1Y1VCN2_9FUNG|nr:subtilisin-like protein [Piromyces finnis]|eukprot:ORX52636.1 subtilisin-like protein [Piromyces finnis]